MKLFETKKLEELLQQNWTKYIDYKMLLHFIINAVPLYAPNWPTIVQYKKFQGNKISISQVCITKNNIDLHIDYEVLVDTGVSAGTVDISCLFDGSYTVKQVLGTVYVTQH
jgi:hypothetical protein